MSYLARLVTPKGGVIIDPFMGSGTTGVASAYEGFRFVGIEKNENYFETARDRIHEALIETKGGDLVRDSVRVDEIAKEDLAEWI